METKWRSILLLLTIVVAELWAEDGFIYTGQSIEGEYLGKYLSIVSEKELLKCISDKQKMSEPALAKFLSGRWASNKEFQTAVRRTQNGYRVELFSKKNQEMEFAEWGIDDIIEYRNRLRFADNKSPVPSLDFSEYAYWIRFLVTNTSDAPAYFLIELDKNFFSWFDLFQTQGGEYKMQAGSFEAPLHSRSIIDDRIVHAVNIEPGYNEIYMRVESMGVDTIPLRIWSEHIYRYRTGRADSLSGAIFGVMIILTFYALFSYFTLHERTYLFLTVLIFFSTLLSLAHSGFGFFMLWPETPTTSTIMLYIFYPLTCAANLLFCRSFLKTGKRVPIIDSILLVFLFAAIIDAILQIFLHAELGRRLLIISLLLDYATVAPLLFASIAILKRGDRIALFLLVGIVFQLLSYIEFWLTSLNIIPLRLLDFLQLRTIGFAVMMFWGIRFKIKTMKNSLDTLRKNMQELINKHKLAASDKPLTDQTKNKIEAVTEYLETHYCESLSRDLLAASVDISPDHLGRMFKKYTGEKISDYINRLRIEKACGLLEKNTGNIIDIAFDVGFDSLRTFNKNFFEITGKTPSVYRKETLISIGRTEPEFDIRKKSKNH